MQEMLQLAYGSDFEAHVVPPGRNPIYFNPFITKEDSVLAIGRLWDTGKQVSLLTQHTHGLPVCIVGADNPVPAPPVPIRADVPVSYTHLDVYKRQVTSFKLYRNLDALYDVFGSVVESAGAFGTKDEFQSLGNDMTGLETARRAFGERMQKLTASKEDELTHLRAQVKTLSAGPPAPPKKIVVDDTEPAAKPPAKKKAAPKPKPPAATTPAPTATPPSKSPGTSPTQ